MRADQNDSQPHRASGPRRPRWARARFAALRGLIAGFCALCVAGLVAAVVRPEAGPVTSVGGAVIDRTPPAVKDFAVRNFGTADKLALQLGILALLAVFAMAVGVLALRHRRLGAAAVLISGVVGAVAAVGRPEGRPGDALPSVVGALVAAGVLYLLIGRPAPRTLASPAAGETTVRADRGTFDRRGRVTASQQARASASRGAVTLPVPASAARAVPRGADPGIRGLSSFVTPNKAPSLP